MRTAARYRRKLRKDSRTLPVKGYGDDEGKYFRCWNCGFVCDNDRDALSDRSTITYEQFGANTYSGHITIRSGHVLIQLDQAGDAQPVKLAYSPKAESGGCPLCHTKNWKGK